jgi:FMN phosphatase YigB (HAD superfamily)
VLAGAALRQYFVHPFGPDLVDLPDKSVEFYRRVFDYVGVPPEQAIVIDDNGEPLAMAKEAGARTVFVGRGHAPEQPIASPDAAITSMADLPAAVGKLM